MEISILAIFYPLYQTFISITPSSARVITSPDNNCYERNNKRYFSTSTGPKLCSEQYCAPWKNISLPIPQTRKEGCQICCYTVSIGELNKLQKKLDNLRESQSNDSTLLTPYISVGAVFFLLLVISVIFNVKQYKSGSSCRTYAHTITTGCRNGGCQRARRTIVTEAEDDENRNNYDVQEHNDVTSL